MEIQPLELKMITENLIFEIREEKKQKEKEAKKVKRSKLIEVEDENSEE